MQVGRMFFLWAVGVLALGAQSTNADSWMPPSEKSFYSDDESVRFTVTPRDIESPLAYFEDKVDGAEPAGQQPAGQPKATGVLYRRGFLGLWTIVWRGALVNDVAPVDALVSASGHYVVTFDNWHSIGYGDNVVVIYGPDGKVIRSMALTDIVPQDYMSALSRSVSSVYWSGQNRIEGANLVLKVAWPGRDSHRFLDVIIDLSSGRVFPPDEKTWREAMAAAAAVNAEEAREEEAWRTRRRSPLLGPVNGDDEAWLAFLEEAFFRIDAEWEDSYPARTVLSPPGAKDRNRSLQRLGEVLTGDRYGDGDRYGAGIYMCASQSQSDLAEEITRIAAGIPDNSLKASRIYIAVGDDHWPGIERALAHTQAHLIQLDPAEPIPQRKERMPR